MALRTFVAAGLLPRHRAADGRHHGRHQGGHDAGRHASIWQPVPPAGKCVHLRCAPLHLRSHAILRRDCWSRFLQLAVQWWQTRALCTSRSTSPSHQQRRRPSSSQVAQSLPRRLQPCLRFWPLSPAAVRTQPLQPPCSSIRGSVATALQRLRRLLPCVDFRYALHQWTTTIPLNLSQPYASRRRIRPFSPSQPQATTALTVKVSVRIALVQARRLAGRQLDTAAALANNHTISTGEVMA